MATQNITINNQAWTEVIPDGGKGLFSNPLSVLVSYRQEVSQPLDTEINGHPLIGFESVNADLNGTTGAVYARIQTKGDTFQGDLVEGIVAFTPSA